MQNNIGQKSGYGFDEKHPCFSPWRALTASQPYVMQVGGKKHTYFSFYRQVASALISFWQAFLAVLMSLALAPSYAADLEQAIDAQVKMDVAAQKSQKKVAKLADETTGLVAEYLAILRQLDSLQTYNDQLEKLVLSQSQELNSIDTQLKAIEITRRDIVPLMLKMVDVLAQFVKLDMPFLPDERHNRVLELQTMMERADVALVEKYRRILEAYQVETEYGRTIEAYQGDLTMDGNIRTVDFLRVGRVSLYYLTLDGLEVGIWDDGWQRLDDSYRQTVSLGIKVARKQLPPDLLVLPVHAVSVAQ